MPDAADKMQEVQRILRDLRLLEDVLDSFIVTSSGQRYSVQEMPSKISNVQLLNLLYSTMSQFISLLSRLYTYKSDRIVVELQDLMVLIYAINQNTVLVCIVPNLANVGLLEVEMENARRELKQVIG